MLRGPQKPTADGVLAATAGESPQELDEGDEGDDDERTRAFVRPQGPSWSQVVFGESTVVKAPRLHR